jgi:tetratricopeptide (TPR) repeat protein
MPARRGLVPLVRATLAVALAPLLVVTLQAHITGAETPSDAALGLIIRYHEDPTRIDRARDLLEAALERERRVDTLITLARVYLLVGDVRATTTDEKLAAYDRGRELGRRAVELAPKSEEAHLWYVANTGRWGQTKGVMRSLFLLPTVRRELDAIFELNPASPRGHDIAGKVMLELPTIIGGDRGKAEEHFKKALAADPHYTLARIDLAGLHITTSRYREARQELQRVLKEPSPTYPADWNVKDLPRARQLLESIRDRR